MPYDILTSTAGESVIVSAIITQDSARHTAVAMVKSVLTTTKEASNTMSEEVYINGVKYYRRGLPWSRSGELFEYNRVGVLAYGKPFTLAEAEKDSLKDIKGSDNV